MEDIRGERAMMPLQPDYIWVLRARAALAGIVPVVVLAGLEQGLPPELGIPRGLISGVAVLLALLALFLLPRRRWRAWGYREEEDELHVRHGLLIRYRTVVPFGRVQHIDIARGPLERYFGLSTLVLHTAGTHNASILLPGLGEHDAVAMREVIREKIAAAAR